MQAIELGDLLAVKKLVKGGTNPNFDTGNIISSSPLYFAAFKGRIDILKWLVDEGGADFNFDTVTYFSQNLSQFEAASYLSSKLMQ